MAQINNIKNYKEIIKKFVESKKYLRYAALTLFGALNTGLLIAVVMPFKQILEDKHFGMQYFILEKILEELSIAVFVSIFIAWVIEQASHDQITSIIDDRLDNCRKITTNILSATKKSQDAVFFEAFRRHVPKDILSAIDSTVLSTKFYRTNHRVHWHLKLAKLDNEHKISASITTGYTLTNLTGNEEKFSIKIHIDKKSSIPPSGKVVEYIMIDGEDIDMSGLNISQATNGNPNIIYEFHPITIPPGGKISIKSRINLIKKLEDMGYWLTLYPEDGMELCIYDPDNCIGLEDSFKVDPIGPFKPIITKADSELIVLIKNALLPFQGIIISWKYEVKKNGSGITVPQGCSPPSTCDESEYSTKSSESDSTQIRT